MKRATIGLISVIVVAVAIPWTIEASPIRIAVLPLRPFSTKSEYSMRWDTSIQRQLVSQLLEVPSKFQVVPSSSLQYAFHQLGLNTNQQFSDKTAQKLAELAEAQYSFFGTYEERENGWTLDAKIISASTGEKTNLKTTPATNWFTIFHEVIREVVRCTGVSLTPEEATRLFQPITADTKGFEILAITLDDLSENRKSLKEMETNARYAISLDDKSAKAYYTLGTILMLLNDLDGASVAAKRSISIDSESSFNHLLLGSIFFFEQLYSKAREELNYSIRLNPWNYFTYIRLSEIESRTDRQQEAIAMLNEAKKVAPYDTLTHAELGRTYAALAKKAEALSELRVAEGLRVSPGKNDLKAEHIIGDAYAIINDFPAAIAHYERFVAAAEKGTQPHELERVKGLLISLKQRLLPHLLTVTAPKEYSDEQLTKLLSRDPPLTELREIPNPLKCSLTMKQWARENVQGAKDDLDKSERLFSLLTKRVGLPSDVQNRTAQEVFKAWSDPSSSFTCQEQTLLYIALARSVGLRVYYCDVRKDYLGMPRLHACAAVFNSDTNATLVDFTYVWFGIPHQEYKVQDDLHTVGIFLAETGNIDQQEFAVKLIPDLQEAWLGLANTYIQNGEMKKAREAIGKGSAINPTTWMVYFSNGYFDVQAGDWQSAINDLEKTLKLNPEYHKSHYLLGVAMAQDNRKDEALEEFRKCIAYSFGDSTFAQAARDAMSKITR